MAKRYSASSNRPYRATLEEQDDTTRLADACVKAPAPASTAPAR